MTTEEGRVAPAPRALTDEEWGRRFKDRLMERGGFLAESAQGVLEARPLQEHREGFEDDPEGAADEELSNYDDDE